jgi:hypothetical protein
MRHTKLWSIRISCGRSGTVAEKQVMSDSNNAPIQYTPASAALIAFLQVMFTPLSHRKL